MNALEPVHPAVRNAETRAARTRRAVAPSGYELAGPVQQAILCARQLLCSDQRPDGTWLAMVRGDAAAASHVLVLYACHGHNEECVAQLAESIEFAQRPQGGWSRYPGGPLDLSVSVQAYLALRMTGYDPTERTLARARHLIRAAGGADRCDTATRALLAFAGQISYDDSPTLPPELLLASPQVLRLLKPGASRWLRRNLPALAIAWSHRATLDHQRCTIRELFVDFPRNWPADPEAEAAGRIRRHFEKQFIRWEQRGWLPLRRRALARAEAELLWRSQDGRTTAEELVWHIIALEALGFARNSAEVRDRWRQIEELVWADPQTGQVMCQPYTTRCEDTADAIGALVYSGVPAQEAPLHAAGHALAHVVSTQNPSTMGPFELSAALRALHELRHDSQLCKDALPPVLSILAEVGAARPNDQLTGEDLDQRVDEVALKLVTTLRNQQLNDGGWSTLGASDEAPSSSTAATAAAIIALSAWRLENVDHAICRGLRYLQSVQRADGSWPGQDGARLVQGTAWALRALIAAGVAPNDPHVVSGVHWLLLQQRSSGGWREAPEGHDLDRENAESPVETAWALQALLAAGEVDADAVKRGVHYLLETQQPFGGWNEPYFVVHHEPNRSSLREMLAVAEPLQALSRWALAFTEQGGDPPLRLKLVRAE